MVDNLVLISFGGGNCFSFGSHMNAGILGMRMSDSELEMDKVTEGITLSACRLNDEGERKKEAPASVSGHSIKPNESVAKPEKQNFDRSSTHCGAHNLPPSLGDLLHERAPCVKRGFLERIVSAKANKEVFANVIARREPVIFQGIKSSIWLKSNRKRRLQSEKTR